MRGGFRWCLMSESLSDAVREAAQAQAASMFPPRAMALHGGATVDLADPWRNSFEAGAVWVAGRLPSRDEIAEALFGEYGCACGYALENHSPLEREDSYRGADKILALIREHVARG